MIPFLKPFQDQFQPQFDPIPMMVLGACGGLIFTVVIVYFLVTRKEAFEIAARAR